MTVENMTAEQIEARLAAGERIECRIQVGERDGANQEMWDTHSVDVMEPGTSPGTPADVFESWAADLQNSPGFGVPPLARVRFVAVDDDTVETVLAEYVHDEPEAPRG